MWSAKANTVVPDASTSSMMSIIPSSNPAPLVTSRSAFSIDSACRADGAKSCGSEPTGMITSTSANSPTVWVTMSPRMFVVTTIVGSSTSGAVVVAGVVSAGVVSAGGVVSFASSVSAGTTASVVSEAASSEPQATASTPSEQTATTRLRVRIFLIQLS